MYLHTEVDGLRGAVSSLWKHLKGGPPTWKSVVTNVSGINWALHVDLVSAAMIEEKIH